MLRLVEGKHYKYFEPYNAIAQCHNCDIYFTYKGPAAIANLFVGDVISKSREANGFVYQDNYIIDMNVLENRENIEETIQEISEEEWKDITAAFKKYITEKI